MTTMEMIDAEVAAERIRQALTEVGWTHPTVRVVPKVPEDEIPWPNPDQSVVVEWWNNGDQLEQRLALIWQAVHLAGRPPYPCYACQLNEATRSRKNIIECNAGRCPNPDGPSRPPRDLLVPLAWPETVGPRLSGSYSSNGRPVTLAIKAAGSIR